MKTTTGAPAGDGRIPFTLRIGVTGHRKFEDPAALGPAIREAIGRIKEMIPSLRGPGAVLIAVSSLAEGADRMVAEAVLAEQGSRLEAVLPLAAPDYRRDFAGPDSEQQFERLLAQASHTWTAPASGSREEAYERAGCYVVDRSDVMIALWDGEPPRGRGGTAAIISYARDRRVPLVWVRTTGEPEVTSELGGARADVIRAAARQLAEYNAGVIGSAQFEAAVRSQAGSLRPELPAGAGVDPVGMAVEKAAAWLVPYFVRADILAMRLQGTFRLLSGAVFGMAAAAVTVVAMQVTIWPDLNGLVSIEVVALLCLLAIPLLSRRWRLHDRWISYRFLAERLRSAYFLTLAGTGDRRRQAARLAYLYDPSETWIEQALTEVVGHRPEITTPAPGVASLRGYLSRYWIGGQLSYHEKTARTHRRWDDGLVRATAVLFSLTLVAAFLHMLGLGEQGPHRSSLAMLLIVVSISVPAVGAAVHGISTQRQFRRHAQRYSRMAGLLTRVQEEMDRAASLEEIRELAAETELIMREENSDWFGVMRFHDMELIT
jgi:hypothetical protein